MNIIKVDWNMTENLDEMKSTYKKNPDAELLYVERMDSVLQYCDEFWVAMGLSLDEAVLLANELLTKVKQIKGE